MSAEGALHIQMTCLENVALINSSTHTTLIIHQAKHSDLSFITDRCNGDEQKHFFNKIYLKIMLALFTFGNHTH